MTRFIIILTLLCGTVAQASLDPLMLSPGRAPGDPVPTVVLDMDNSVCMHIRTEESSPGLFYKNSPETTLIPYHENFDPKKRGFYMHAFFPGTPELFITLLSWGWNVYPFSAGVDRRNKKVISVFLKQTFSAYFSHANDTVDLLLNDSIHNRIRIYSQDHLLVTRSPLSIRVTEDPKPIHKKNLNHIKLPVEHSILVDDNLDYAVEGEQYPPLSLTNGSATLFRERHLRGKPFDTNVHGHDASKNAAYVLGVLSRCRNLMLQDKITLRQALRTVLTIPQELRDPIDEEEWILDGPGFHVERKDAGAPLATYQKQFFDTHIKIGSEIIENLRKQRTGKIQSQLSKTPYEDLTDQLYGVRNHSDIPLRSSQPKREDQHRAKPRGCSQIHPRTPMMLIGIFLLYIYTRFM